MIFSNLIKSHIQNDLISLRSGTINLKWNKKKKGKKKVQCHFPRQRHDTTPIWCNFYPRIEAILGITCD